MSPLSDRPPSLAPAQLALRFALEIAALLALGAWARQLALRGAAHSSAAIALPLLAAIAWSTFAVPGDPSRSGNAPVAIPGWLRLALELALFIGAALALFALARWASFAAFSVALVAHHALTRTRIRWLLRH